MFCNGLLQEMTHKEILDDFSQLKDDDILACLSYAANKERVIKVA
jgi:uncharacterized protein (DUF433 family)